MIDPTILPTVSVIVPTTKDREHYLERIKQMYADQDYPNKEIIISHEEGISLGRKRNKMNEEARGSIIVHWDVDDYYGPSYISDRVHDLVSHSADIAGISVLHFYNEHTGQFYLYSLGTLANGVWVAGATMCYRKTFWETNRFKDITDQEDNHFLIGVVSSPRIYNAEGASNFMASIHNSNTCPRRVDLPMYREIVGADEISELKERWAKYL